MSPVVFPGDIVRQVKDGKEVRKGYCKELKGYGTVQIVGTDWIIEQVPSERLWDVAPYCHDAAISLGVKYGRINDVDQKVTMQSKCGSTVEILSSINFEIEDYWFIKRQQSDFDNFYLGQEVVCIPNNLEQPNWIIKSEAMKRSMEKRQRFTVQKVEPIDMEVVWYDDNSSVSEKVKAKDIKKLHILQPIENAHLKLKERRLLKLSSSDFLIKRRSWLLKKSALNQPEPHKVTHTINIARNKKRGPPKLRHPYLLPTCASTSACTTETEEEWLTEEDWCTEESELEEISDNDTSSNTKSASRHYAKHFPRELREQTVAVEILCRDSKATVVWQDGEEEKNIPTKQLCSSISLHDHEFFPGEWVMREGTDMDSFGVIQQVNNLEQTATVKWFESVDDLKNPSAFSEVLEKSVYDLKKHPKFTFRPGDAVKLIPIEENKLGSVLDSYPAGYVIVQWIDGSKENFWPHRLEVIPEIIYPEDSSDNNNNNNNAQASPKNETIESTAEDLTETTLKNLAAGLYFIRSRVIYLKEIIKQHNYYGTFSVLKELLIIYGNSSYLDTLLDTSFFSIKSRHFQLLLTRIKDEAEKFGMEFTGRLFSGTVDLPTSLSLITDNLEKENIDKVSKLEHEVNALANQKGLDIPLTSLHTFNLELLSPTDEKICVELLSMMKARMDLAYAEIISRIGGPPAITVMTKASDPILIATTPLPSMPTCNDSKLNQFHGFESEMYCLLEDAPTTHHFFSKKFKPTDMKNFFKAVQNEHKLLKESLPPGIWVRTYTNRMDLLSVMIKGPSTTPYEDGLFLFDIQLSHNYPCSPPLCHYISYTSERLNPNLYVEGKVCVSLLGTWMGHKNEMWSPNSTLLQLIVSIQGLILVSEPYYNEPDFEKQAKSQQGNEDSRAYNELVILKLVQSMTELLRAPPEIFKNEIYNHFRQCGKQMCERLQNWCSNSDSLKPEFPLLPVSKGLRLSLETALQIFKTLLDDI